MGKIMKARVGIYQKTNHRGNVIYFSQHILRGIKLNCAKARF